MREDRTSYQMTRTTTCGWRRLALTHTDEFLNSDLGGASLAYTNVSIYASLSMPTNEDLGQQPQNTNLGSLLPTKPFPITRF